MTMLTHSGILMLKKGTKTGGLFFHQNLSPYDFPKQLFGFISKMKEQEFSNQFNTYFENVQIVEEDSIINEQDRKIVPNVEEGDTWIKLSHRHKSNELDLVDILFSASFSELPDISKSIDPEEESDFSLTNHLYIVDLEERTVSFFIGGIGYNFNRSLVYEQKFEDFVDNEEENINVLLERYDALLQLKENELNERWN